MAKKIAVILSLFLMANISFAEEPGRFKPGSEPDGFRGIKWGLSINTLRRAGYHLKFDFPMGLATFAFKREEPLTLGKAEVEKIDYLFWRNKFYSVIITAKGDDNCELLKKYLFEEFGEIAKTPESNSEIERYLWKADTATAYFEYDRTLPEALINIASTKISKEIEKLSEINPSNPQP